MSLELYFAYVCADALTSGSKSKGWEDRMPEIIIHLAEVRAADQKRALMRDITDAVVKNLGAKPETVTVSIIETPRALKMKGGVLFSER